MIADPPTEGSGTGDHTAKSPFLAPERERERERERNIA